MQQEVFQECLEALTVCTGHGKTAHSRTRALYKGHKGSCSVVLEVRSGSVDLAWFGPLFWVLLEGCPFWINAHVPYRTRVLLCSTVRVLQVVVVVVRRILWALVQFRTPSVSRRDAAERRHLGASGTCNSP